ncbi:MAG TPA: hypothetical protein VNA67_04290 [Pseudonocardiaceae bacterium]|nr:hypothetical protein [Pseudonocardiaceae bacterium]
MNTLISRLRSRPIVSLIGVVALLLAGVLGVTALMLKDGAVETREVVNIAGGYRFEAPEGWSTTQQDRTTTVTSPDQSTVITLGLSRPGSLPVASTLFFQQVASKYRDVQMIPPQAKSVGPLPALIYGGNGTNAKDTRVRFLAITVKNEPTNYGITVFTAAGSDPKTVLPEVNRVVDTFRALPPPRP